MTLDQIEYLGKLAAWLRACPEGKLPYGEFYPSKISVVFDGESIGCFVNDDPDWMFYTEEDK